MQHKLCKVTEGLDSRYTYSCLDRLLLAEMNSLKFEFVTMFTKLLATRFENFSNFQYGLYSGFMGCFVYVFFGSTNYVTIGPTGTHVLLDFARIL